ncbi:MAG: UDP-N-acetylmuramoyl-L-alanyl-D-glutamate--2,6-diaminopimelate ligase [Candidatus Bipolaricaulota bacterium]|nr:UDP-N-acetylmuramoyl-L-alanyl-D-glutamate--2,6-diaminopimelate ligase [Candidatus Bipolaricaulota bacterium]MDW8126319.1 UDP-N-acetylmuramoyl-L-alanyl-D-glutamate--2,6-diaminopimelate ligase [Candidatus Bipolaricaulota bacterium]
MPRLNELLACEGLPNVLVTGLAWDSRKVKPGDVFFAIPGGKFDGHAFISAALAKGAVAVVGEQPISGLAVPYVRVENARAALAQAACAFYGHPTKKLTTIGVTGTNGKTTVVHLLGQLLPHCEALTTVRVEEENLSCVTTPEAPDLQRIAAEAFAAGKRFFAFEASSIGLAQRRVDGVHLACAVFTSFSRDHLDFHGTMEAYLSAKLRLFQLLRFGAPAVVCTRAPVSAVAAAAPHARLITYGIEKGDVQATAIRRGKGGMSFRITGRYGHAEAFLPCPGIHNVENALAAITVGLSLGFPLADLLERLADAQLPLGRFAQFQSSSGATVVVDFAHNPEALRCALAACRPWARRLIAVFGCPGESDQGKRRIMGAIAGRLADLVVITSDNPKSEDPRAIAAEIAAGVAEVGGTWAVILERALAIRWALNYAGPGDFVVVAGKGHERYQYLADRREAFSDLATVQELVGTVRK